MTPNMRMEQFSLAYVRAVAANAGYQVTRPEPDVDSVDGVLMASFRRRPRIEFQAKATARNVSREGIIHYPLPVKNYDDLRADTLAPRILIVLLMPDEQSEWLAQTDDELCLRYGAYWLSLEGHPSVSNTSSVTVPVPTANIFSSEQLINLMGKVEKGDSLC